MRPRARALVCLAALFLLVRPTSAQVHRVEPFDLYTNHVLARLLETKNVKEIKSLAPNDIVEHDRVLAGATSAFLVVRTNGGRLARLLVQAARQKVDDEKQIPILYVVRFVTFKDGEERAIHSSGGNVSLFPDFRLSLDLGQVVPEALGGDLRFRDEGGKVRAEPVGKAKLYLVTRGLDDLVPKKGPKLVVGEKFDPAYFNGRYKLHDDGRRSGTLTLEVSADGKVSGHYFSDRDGSKYDVVGKVGTPAHKIEFSIRLPRIEHQFRGMLFTGDGRALAGTSRLAERESAFYAVRLE